MPEPRISVALCTYNGARYLTEQLESILRQSQPPDEIIICDDRSTDDTIAIIDSFIKEYPGVIHLFINEETLHVKKNFEKAIRLCTGDLIFLSDQDDIWEPGKAEKVMTYFSEHPDTDVVFTNAYILENDKRSEKNAWDLLGFNGKRKEKLHNRGELLKHLFLKWNIATGATMALRSTAAAVHIPFAGFTKHLHDYQLALQSATGGSLGFIDECLIGYRLHSAQQVGIQTPVRPLLLRPFYKVRYLLNKLRLAPSRIKAKKSLAKHLQHFTSLRFPEGKVFIERFL